MASPMAHLQLKKAGGSHHRFSRINRHSLRDGLRLIRVLPGVHDLFSHRHRRNARSIVANLAPAKGCQDHATSPSTSGAFVSRAIRVHRIPAPRVVTIGRNVPLHRGGMREKIVVICPTRQARMPAADWHDGQFGHGGCADLSVVVLYVPLSSSSGARADIPESPLRAKGRRIHSEQN
jgi:hypothetical protein